MVYRSVSVIFGLWILSAMIAHWGYTEGKHWPDFSCYTPNDTVTHRNAISHYRMGWESCKENYKVNKGKCDKLCVLVKRAIIVRTSKNGPFDFNTDAFLVIFREELGYGKKDNPPVDVQELLNNVKLQLEDCKKNHPEYGTLTVKNTPCEPWNNITQCIEKAVGCGLFDSE